MGDDVNTCTLGTIERCKGSPFYSSGDQLDGLGGDHVVWEGTTCIMSSSGREMLFVSIVLK